MGMNEQIEHEGIVKEVSRQSVKVGFIAQPSCAGCHAKGVCSMEEKEGESIEIFNFGNDNYSIGEKVKIIINESMGLKAVFIAYIMPFILVLISLFILTNYLDKETLAGIFSLLLLVPYYLLIYFYRAKIKKEINFTIEKYR